MAELNVYDGSDCLYTWRGDERDALGVLTVFPRLVRSIGHDPDIYSEVIARELCRDLLERADQDHRQDFMLAATFRLFHVGNVCARICEGTDVDIDIRSGVRLNA